MVEYPLLGKGNTLRWGLSQGSAGGCPFNQHGLLMATRYQIVSWSPQSDGRGH